MAKISETSKAVMAAIRGYLSKDVKGNYKINPMYRMPIYLEGAPGIGKTELCAQVAEQLNIGFISYSLVHCSRNNVLGLPVIRELQDGRKYTIYTMSEIIAAVYKAIESGTKEGILLLDEFPCISDSLAPMMLAFLQSKVIGEYKLPDGWVIMLAGNPPKYNKSARYFDMATMDRIRKIVLEQDTEDYLTYAKTVGVHRTIIEYLQVSPKDCYLIQNERNQETECVTCRSWSNLSEAMLIYEELGQVEDMDLSFVMQFIKSEMIARKFLEYYQMNRHELSVEEMNEIFAGKINDGKIKILAALPYAEKWKLTGIIINYTIAHALDMSCLSKKGMEHQPEEIGECLNCMFLFLDMIDREGSLSDRLADAISSSPDMMPLISMIRVEEYEKHLMRKYGIA